MKRSMNISPLLAKFHSKVSSNRVSRRFLHEDVWTADSPVLNEGSIKNHLNKLSIPFKDGYTCLQLKDCFCGQKTRYATNKGRVYINKRTGFFLCETCKATCDWIEYSSLLTKIKSEKVDVQFYKKYWGRYDQNNDCWNEVCSDTESLHNFFDADFVSIINNFQLPHCSMSVFYSLNVRINKERNKLFFPLSCGGAPVVGYKIYNKNGKEDTFPKMDCPGFLLHSTSPKTSAIIVGNIKDFLALISQNLNYDIICLQYGSSHLPQSSLPFFEKYNRIVLWFGVGNIDSIGHVARKLHEKRCYVVRQTNNQISSTAAVENKENISDIIAKAKLTWHQYVTTFTAFREEILDELKANYKACGTPWKRFPLLTKILKGHRRGELTVLTGPTGVGKTTFLSEYSLDLAAQGVNTLWGSFEIKNTRLAKIMLTQFAGGPIPQVINEYNDLCNKFEDLPIFFLTFHGHQEIYNVMDAVKHCSYTYDIAHVIIDNIQFMIDVSPDVNQMDRFWKQDFMIQSFRNFATMYNCHVTLVMHPKKIEGVELTVNSIFGGVKASQEADNVLIMQKKEMNLGVKKYMQVCKNRYSGDLGIFPLPFDKGSLSFSKTNNVRHVEYSEPEPIDETVEGSDSEPEEFWSHSE